MLSGVWVLVEPMEGEKKDLNQRNQRVGREKKRKELIGLLHFPWVDFLRGEFF